MILIFVVPLVVALSLCLLPPGRQAVLGIGITAVVLAALWVIGGGDQGAGLTGTYALMAAPGVALAALAHLTYRILGPRLPVWGYAAAAVVFLIGLSAVMKTMAGS